MTKIFLQSTVCMHAFLNMAIHTCNYIWMGCRYAWMSLSLCSIWCLFSSVQNYIGWDTWETYGCHCFSLPWDAVAVPATITITSPSLLLISSISVVSDCPFFCFFLLLLLQCLLTFEYEKWFSVCVYIYRLDRYRYIDIVAKVDVF